MNEANLAKNISEFRKQKGITQEQMATALNISPQAVSKWETGASVPDTMTLPLIAEYFGVGIDSLFYGRYLSANDLYEACYQASLKHPQMSKESYEEALCLFTNAFHGISHGNLRNVPGDCVTHISNENGVALSYGNGYGAVVTREFFKKINRNTVSFAENFFSLLVEKNCLLVLLAIVSMSDIGFFEMQEKTKIPENELRTTLDFLIQKEIVVEKKVKHKSLGNTYELNEFYHTCLCIIISTAELQRETLVNGIACCMGFGDFPVDFETK